MPWPPTAEALPTRSRAPVLQLEHGLCDRCPSATPAHSWRSPQGRRASTTSSLSLSGSTAFVHPHQTTSAFLVLGALSEMHSRCSLINNNTCTRALTLVCGWFLRFLPSPPPNIKRFLAQKPRNVRRGGGGGGSLDHLQRDRHGVAYPPTRVNARKPPKVLFGYISTSRSARRRQPRAVWIPADTWGSDAR